MTHFHTHLLPTCLAIVVAAFSTSCHSAPGTDASIRDGNARFTVLTDTLIRLEYADDGRFEDRPTQTVGERPEASTEYTTWVEDGARVVRTAALTLRYRQGSGVFASDNLAIVLNRGTETATAVPQWGATAPDVEQLGGWARSLDLVDGAIALQPGVLSRRGWQLIDDSLTALLIRTSPHHAERPARAGSYQDGYFFGYGLDYRRALSDLRVLAGPAPLLPRKAFGVWFSRYWSYSAADWQAVVAAFRQNAVPLDSISVDTDWKKMTVTNFCPGINALSGAPPDAACSWNGWTWNEDLYPDPASFVAWAHGTGLEVGLNIHPSVNTIDPAYATFAGVLGQRPNEFACQLLQGDFDNDCLTFDWGDASQLDAYFALHRPIADTGIDFFWLDWCCERSEVNVPGLTADTWINAQYAREHRRMGSRWPAFSRIGGAYVSYGSEAPPSGPGAFAEHRSTLHFTGDTCSTWPMIDFVAAFSASEGAAIGLPYVSHDIGSFHGERLAGEACSLTPPRPQLPDDMYVRWLQLGTFQPLDRLHSQHGLRLPWEYTGAAATIGADFLRLRGRLVPYLYSLAREAHDTGMPMVRALYLSWPTRDEAYQSPSHFTLGDGVFVATVAEGGVAPLQSFWLPPGQWYDFFDGGAVAGDAIINRTVPLDRYPVYVRAGTIVPMQRDLPTSSVGPQDGLTLSIWAGADGEFSLYEDEGTGFGYERDVARRTRITSREPSTTCRQVTIEAAVGPTFTGSLATRSWTLEVVGADAPGLVSVGGVTVPEGASTPGWSYDVASRKTLVRLGTATTSTDLVVTLGAGCP